MSAPKGFGCRHGIEKELLPYRGIRIWQMRCGEVQCELSSQDFFLPQFINEWIDGVFDDKIDGWREIRLDVLKRARAAQ